MKTERNLRNTLASVAEWFALTVLGAVLLTNAWLAVRVLYQGVVMALRGEWPLVAFIGVAMMYLTVAVIRRRCPGNEKEEA